MLTLWQYEGVRNNIWNRKFRIRTLREEIFHIISVSKITLTHFHGLISNQQSIDYLWTHSLSGSLSMTLTFDILANKRFARTICVNCQESRKKKNYRKILLLFGYNLPNILIYILYIYIIYIWWNQTEIYIWIFIFWGCHRFRGGNKFSFLISQRVDFINQTTTKDKKWTLQWENVAVQTHWMTQPW